MILVDTSVWIDFFGKTNPPHVKKLVDVIESNENISISGIVLTEVLQGVRDNKQYDKIKKYFQLLVFLPMDYEIFILASSIYRNLRKKGIIIRKPVAYMIAATAIYHQASLLHNDRDFEPIAQYCGLKIVEV